MNRFIQKIKKFRFLSRACILGLTGGLLLGIGTVTCVQAQETATPNLVKLNPLAFANGYFPIAYERVLFNRLGVELGVGITTRDFLYHTLYESANNSDKIGTFGSAQFGFGTYGALRFYMTKQKAAPEGAFLAAHFQYRGHRWEQQYTITNTLTRADMDITAEQTRSLTDLAILFGWQAPMFDSVYAEFSLGLGLRYRVIDRFKVEENSDGIKTLKEDNPPETVPMFPMNLKIGYAF